MTRMIRKIRLGFWAFLLLSLPGSQRLFPQDSHDLVLIHGHILTVDQNDSVAQALAIQHGVIVKIGSDAEVLELASKSRGIRVIDLEGHTATPGLIDTHAHIAEGGVNELYRVQLSEAASIQVIVDRVKSKIAQARPGEWVTGAGWDEGKLAECRYVTAADLDAVSPKNPVWLVHTTGHYGTANSMALKMAQITAATADPEAGTIDRDPQGNPTGVLKESATRLVTRLVPPITPEQMRNGILHIEEVLHSEGMTSVKDPLIELIQWDAYKSLLDEGKLKERICAHAVGDRAMDWVVDTYALVEKEHPLPELRHSIIHANLPTTHALDIMAELQKKYDAGYPEMQAEFLWWIGDNYAGNYGPKRNQNLVPLKTMLRRGILWSAGSDYFVTPLPARYGIWASVARQTAKGIYGANPFGMAEAVDIHVALRSYTAWAARQM